VGPRHNTAQSGIPIRRIGDRDRFPSTDSGLGRL